MHLIKDENGNLVHHGHEHTHADGTVHSHSHSHEEGDSHNHLHGDVHSDEESKNKTLILMQYMLEHNEHHADELAQMADDLVNYKAVADEIMEAVAVFRKGNKKLANAVKLMNSCD